MTKDAFDLWWEWAEKPVGSKLTIDAAIHDVVMALPPDERRDRAKVNEAVPPMLFWRDPLVAKLPRRSALTDAHSTPRAGMPES
jgi:hypothetical protein